MAQTDMQVELRFRWWFWLYLRTLGFLCQVFGCEPNWDRVFYWFTRGIVVRVNGKAYRRRRFPSRAW